MAKPRVRQLDASGKQPRQSIAGYYPKSWKKLPANVRRKEVTAEEALAAFQNEPMSGNRKQRMYIYGAHASYRKGQDQRYADVLASANRRGPMVRRLTEIKADVDAYEAQAELESLQYYGVSSLSELSKDARQELTRDVRAYEQSLMVDFATRQMGHEYSRVLGIWVAS